MKLTLGMKYLVAFGAAMVAYVGTVLGLAITDLPDWAVVLAAVPSFAVVFTVAAWVVDWTEENRRG